MQKFCTIKQEFVHKVYKRRLLDYIKGQQKLMQNQGVGAKDILHQKLKSEVQRAQTTQQLYNSTFLDDIQESQWKYLISNNVLTKLKNSNQKLESVFTSLLMIVDGCFQSNQEKGYFVQITMPYLNMYQAYFMFSNKNNYFILFEIGLHKEFPKFIAQAQSHFNYEVVHKITILDILQCNKNKQMMDFLIEYQFKLENNFYRSSFKNLVCTSINQGKQCCFLFNPSDSSWPELMFQNNNNTKYLPLTFQTQIEESKNFIFNVQWQETEFNKLQQRKQQISSISNSNYVILKYYSDLAMAGRIIDFIEQSPEFKICPSISEKEIIGTKQNSLVIGRSGTGKTTCAILRIFASQYLLKVKVKMAKEKSTNILQDYNQVYIPMRNAFITANQKLVEKVKEYYDKLKIIVKEVAKKNKQQRQSLDVSTLSQYEQDNSVNDFNALENILDEEQNQEMNENTQMRRKTLKQLQFPCFISTLDLLILLDKQLQKPYFSQDRLNLLRQRFYIQVGFKLVSGINLNEYFPLYNYDKAKIMVPEVDFEMFYDKFWPKVVPHNFQTNDPTALPSLIWTQIYSIIKGSQYSYKYPELSLPYQIYKKQVEKYLSIDQIEQIFHTFIQYEEWKNHQMYFDQLDIVNNILRNFDQLQLELFPLHNIFVDEIQDLPMAVLELMSRIAEQNFMFSGDAAQSILKGVGFRFQDLQSQLENSQTIGINKINNFIVYKLTTNYRSHNNILQVANAIVTILELLFPFSLDKLQKEISNLKGPKPIIFQPNEFPLMVSQLKEQYIGDDCQDIEFGFNQVIITRNLEEKEKIPKIFENIQVLTVFQAKGLEFDDVILYNFFQSDVISEQQWDLLLTLDVEDYIMDSQIYQHNITKHQQQDETEEQFEQNQLVKKLKINYTKYQNKKVNINEYTGLCDELKALYVCITRAKKRLFIFDENVRKRKFLEKILIDQNVCTLVQNYEREIRFYQQINKQSEVRRELTEQEKNQWNEKGQFYFDNQIFDEAIKCFKRSQNKDMVEQAEILNCVKKGKQKKKLYKQYEKQKHLPQFQGLANENFKLFQEYYKLAAQRFRDRGETLNAAKCFYSGRFYFDCIEIHLQENLLAEAEKAAMKAKCPLLASLISIKQDKIWESFEILSQNNCDVLFQQHILNLALSKQLIQYEEVKIIIEKQNYLARSILYLENCQKQEVQVEQQQQQKLSQKQKKNKRKAQHQPQQTFQNFNKQIWEKFYASRVFDDAQNVSALAEQLEEQLEIYQDSQIQLKNSPLIATSIIIKHFDEVYFQLFQTHCIIQNRFNFAQIREEMNQKYSKQEESQSLIDFIVTFLEQGNYINLIQKITQKNKLTYILFQNAELKNENKNNAKALTLPKLDKQSASDILSFESFAYSIATNNLEQYFPYLIENHRKEIIKQEWNEIFDYFQNSIDVVLNQENFIQKSISAYFDQFDSIKYQPKEGDDDLSEKQYLVLKIKMAIKSLQNKTGFLIECFNIQQSKEIKQFENELENKDIEYLQQIVSKIMNFQFRLENQKLYAPQQYLITILENWQYKKGPLPRFEINVLLNQEQQFLDKQPLTFLFQILYRFYHDEYFMSKFFDGCEIRQVFLLLKFLYEGTNLCRYDTLENSAYQAACSFFKFYVFQSSICNFFSPQWAVVHKSSFILSLEDEIETIQFFDQYILVKTQQVIQIAREQFEQILNSIRFIDVLFNIIIRDRSFLKWHKQKFMCEEHIKFLIRDFLDQDIQYSAFNKWVLKDFLKVCSIFNYLRLNTKLILRLEEKSFWNHYIKFQQQNQYAFSFYGLVKWMQFYKQIKFNIFEIYHPELLLHELKQISLTYLLCLLPNSIEMKNTNQLTFNFECLQDQELTALIEKFQIKHSKLQIKEYDDEILNDERETLKTILDYFVSTSQNTKDNLRRFQPNNKKYFNLLLSQELQQLLKYYLFDLNYGDLQLETQYDTTIIEATRLIIALFAQIISEAQVMGIEDSYLEQITKLYFIIALNQKRFFTHIQSPHILQDITGHELKQKLEDELVIDTSKFLLQKLLIFYNTDWADTKARTQDVYKFEIFYKNQCSFNKLVPYYKEVNFYYSLRKKLYQIKNNDRQPDEIQNLYNQIHNLKKLINELSFSSLLSIQQLNDALEIMKNISDQETKLDKLAQNYNKTETEKLQQIVQEYYKSVNLWAQNQINKNIGIYNICEKYLN